MAGSMEAMLLGGDDSSDDSDNEGGAANATAGTSVVAATIQPTASPTPPQQQAQPAASAAPSPAPAQSQPPPQNKSELSQRLKSLYSPASHAKKQLPAAPAAAAPVPPVQQQAAPAPTQARPHPQSASGRSPHHHPGAPPTAPVQRTATQTGGRPPQAGPPRGSSRPPSQGAPGYSSPPGQPPSQQRYSSSSGQPGYQQPPSSYRQSSSSQHRSSSGSSGRPSSSQQPSSSQPPPSMQPRSVPNPVPHAPQQARRGNVTTHDPYEPTPLHKIKEREQKAAAAAAAHAGGAPRGSYPSGSSGGAVPGSSQASEREKEMRRQKERFLMFTRVLMKYLETKDPTMHQKVKAIIKDCAERNKRQERGYESVTASMRERLKHVVGDAYWKRAESYLAHFLAQKQKAGKGGGAEAQRQAAEMKRKQAEVEAQRRARAQQEAARQKQIAEQRKQQQAQQAAQAAQHAQQQAQQQQHAAQAQQPAQPASVTPSQSAPPPAKVARAPSSVGKGKRPAGGKQATGKTAKKARTSKPTGGKKAATGGAATSSPGSQQQASSMQPVPTTPMAVDTRPPSPPPVREYTELMELVDHAVHFDWTTAGLLMGGAVQKQQLQEEQKNLLYSTSKPPIASPAKESANGQKTEGGVPFALRNWGKRNLVSPRVAWARVRRREQPTAEMQRRFKAKYPEAPPIPTPATCWVHEEKAEDDATLCLLSEATQIYISQILQKALVSSRQRQNLDGIRLWHQQCTAAMELAKAEKESKEKPTPPPLSIRLGCDVSRQVARSMGNAALTSKRMEEALERQKIEDMTRVVPPKEATTLNEATLLSAQSMGELSLLPPMAKAAEKADYEAKRAFEIYGGKESREPPFGRVPKKATLEMIDFQQGMQLNSSFMGGRGNRRHRAKPHAFSFPTQA